jgi:hypothetical protein
MNENIVKAKKNASCATTIERLAGLNASTG